MNGVVDVYTGGSESSQHGGGSGGGGDGGGVLVHVSASDGDDAEQLTMTKTVVIAMSCVVAYLGVMAALTVYCLIHMVRARRMRKLHNQLQQPDERE